MIRYALRCDAAHEFDMWFKDSATYDALTAQSLVSCPDCGSADVRKAMMAPAVGGARPAPAATPSPREIARKLGELREHVLAETTDVGRRFPDEARRMHEGEVEPRPIRGQASPDEVRSLHEDGVPVLPVPPKPPQEN